MKLPRALSGKALIAALGKLGYVVTRQSGSHIRLTTEQNGTHHVTIPDHRPLKVGTLSGILRDVAAHHGMERDALIGLLF
jgi:predicted RNA binding protein YcfA (HicA-like mRNA interferase family)